MNIAPAHLDALQALGYTECGSPVSLYRSHAFRLLHGPAVPGVYRGALGQAHDKLLEQDRSASDTPGPSVSPRAVSSITSSLDASIARSIERTFAIAAPMKSSFIKRRIAILDFVIANQEIRVPGNRIPKGFVFLRQIGHQ